MLTGQQAEAYADHFIAVHIQNMAGGKTYSQLSTESLAQPSNTQLATTVNTVFKGETLRSMLLNAYGWWKVSQIVYIVSLVLFGLGTVAGLAAAYLFTFAGRPRSAAPVAQPGAATRPSPRPRTRVNTTRDRQPRNPHHNRTSSTPEKTPGQRPGPRTPTRGSNPVFTPRVSEPGPPRPQPLIPKVEELAVKTLIVGAGVIGTVYGAHVAAAGAPGLGAEARAEARRRGRTRHARA